MKLPISCIIYALLFITLPATAASDNIETSLLKHISEAKKP